MYSPRRRTALVLLGTGTAGAYHAGVLRALREAGVRLDLVAGRGVGAASALFAAVDADPRLSDVSGLWLDRRGTARLYRWSGPWRRVAAGILLSVVAVAVPLLVLPLLAAVYPLVLAAGLIAPAAAAVLAARHAELVAAALSPEMLASIVPRAATLGVLVLLLSLVAAGLEGRHGRRAGRRLTRGRWWWNVIAAPLDRQGAVSWFLRGFWQFIRGAAPIAQPSTPDLSRRYSELLAESLRQPGYRELIITAHDLDARRDVVFALLEESRRGAFAGAGVANRQADLVDLAGAGGVHAFDALAAALSVPIATEPHAITFAVESYWRGETHRLIDRPGAACRLLEEVLAAGAEQVIVVSAVAEIAAPHTLSRRPVDPRARLGEVVAAAEAAAVRDAVQLVAPRFAALFHVRPAHNPVGPFDFGGAHDDRSDRRHAATELLGRGYEDAYRQFIDPAVGASGETLTERAGVGRTAPDIDELRIRAGP